MVVELQHQNAHRQVLCKRAHAFIENDGKIFACGTCLKIRHSEGSEMCPLSTMKDLHEVVKDSDRVVTF